MNRLKKEIIQIHLKNHDIVYNIKEQYNTNEKHVLGGDSNRT